MTACTDREAIPAKSRWLGLIEEVRLQRLTKHKAHDERQEQYFLLAPFDDIYLTKREHETLISLLEGGSIKSIACDKKLSVRTIEQYIKQTRIKLGFHRKQEMVRTLMLCEYLPKLKCIRPIIKNKY
jgi:DNA-binding CsgD family transcriptional regulator